MAGSSLCGSVGDTTLLKPESDSRLCAKPLVKVLYVLYISGLGVVCTGEARGVCAAGCCGDRRRGTSEAVAPGDGAGGGGGPLRPQDRGESALLLGGGGEGGEGQEGGGGARTRDRGAGGHDCA